MILPQQSQRSEAAMTVRNGEVELFVTVVDGRATWQLRYPDASFGARVNSVEVSVIAYGWVTATGIEPAQGTGIHPWSVMSWGGSILAGNSMRYGSAYITQTGTMARAYWRTELTAIMGTYRAMYYTVFGLGKGYMWTDSGSMSFTGSPHLVSFNAYVCYGSKRVVPVYVTVGL